MGIEVGTGPVRLAVVLPASRAVLVDSRNDFYGSSSVLSAMRSPRVEYVTGRGEELPVARAGFDHVIGENWVGHMEHMHGVLRELVPGGGCA